MTVSESEQGVMAFRVERGERDDDDRVILTGPVPEYIRKQIETREPMPLPRNHPIHNPKATTVSYRKMVRGDDGEWW